LYFFVNFQYLYLKSNYEKKQSVNDKLLKQFINYDKIIKTTQKMHGFITI